MIIRMYPLWEHHEFLLKTPVVDIWVSGPINSSQGPPSWQASITFPSIPCSLVVMWHSVCPSDTRRSQLRESEKAFALPDMKVVVFPTQQVVFLPFLPPWTSMGHAVLWCHRRPQKGSHRRNLFPHNSRGGRLRSGVSRFGFLWGLSPWFADGCLLTGTSPGFSSVHVCLESVSLATQISSSYKDSNQNGLGVTLKTSF